MARIDALCTSAESPAVATLPRRSVAANVLRDAGYVVLLLAAFLLPFDLDRLPLLWTGYLTITNLTVLLFVLAVLAAISLLFPAARPAHEIGLTASVMIASRIRLLGALALFAALLLSSALSTFLAHRSAQGLTWWLEIAIGAILWLAIPRWLAPDPERRTSRLAVALVAGAVLSAIVGLVEVAVGPAFDQFLTAFKPEGTTIGPYLRLSATFTHSNVAAMYFELAMPFAVIGLVRAGIALVANGDRSGYRRDTRLRRWLTYVGWLAAVDVLLVAILLTFTRGAFLGLGAAAVVMLLAARRQWRRPNTERSQARAGRSLMEAQITGNAGLRIHRVGALSRLVSGRSAQAPVALVVLSLIIITAGFALSTASIDRLRLSTQNDSAWYQAGYTSALPPRLIAGRTQRIPVTVQNRSPLLWNASRPYTYGLSYHWLLPSGNIVSFANRITWLTSDLAPDKRQSVAAVVRAPAIPGRYLLVWDMIWKGTTWFGPKTGSYQPLPIQVVALHSSGRTISPIAHSNAPVANRLPNDRPLDRSTIWSIAWRMIRARPLLGEGPQGVRLNYSAYAPSTQRQSSPPAPAHAHNLVLEIAADSGVIGLALWAALLALLWWPLVLPPWRGRTASLWQLAVIGSASAFLAHQTVDFFLETQAIVVVFWMLCGLASALRASPMGLAENLGKD